MTDIPAEPTPDLEPAEPDLIIGSNIGHAIRYAERNGWGHLKSRCHPVDFGAAKVAELTAPVVHCTRPPQDVSACWAEVAQAVADAGGTLIDDIH